MADKPPSPVHLNSQGILLPTFRSVSMTSSKGMTGSKRASAMFAQASALVAAITFLPRQGTSTLFATGSQIIPSVFWSAIDAASTACLVVPSAKVTSAAAAIPDAAPHSA